MIFGIPQIYIYIYTNGDILIYTDIYVEQIHYSVYISLRRVST